ncbi:MAG TPA: endolytic transglycosylase MltG [Ktedonobacterales bacterium]|nr:endolytic transglycosylase MltG [Ktedonobacterales bacterium]
MKGFARVVVVFLTLVALVVGFVGATAALDIFQPTNKHATTVVNFEVKSGDTTASVAQRLQDDGLIRNALLFRVWARYKKLDRGIEQGVYQLNPSMTMNAIIQKLQVGKPDEFFVSIPEGIRATQYPDLFQSLPNFNADDFLKMAKTGVEPDGTKLWTKYWFIKQPSSKTAYALEGYLYPAGYYFFHDADTKTVVEKLLTQFGEELCPGPDNKPDAYIGDAKQCRANAVKVNGKNIFDLMHAAYPDAKDDVTALNDALIISSFAVEEIRSSSGINSAHYADNLAGVASVYHNRYLNIETQGTADVGYKMGSDPSVAYALYTQKPPADGKWWVFSGDGNKLAPTSPYNTYTQAGMPPGPISNVNLTQFEAGAAPQKSPNYYFVSDKCGAMHYATNYNDFVNKVEPAMNAGNC